MKDEIKTPITLAISDKCYNILAVARNYAALAESINKRAELTEQLEVSPSQVIEVLELLHQADDAMRCAVKKLTDFASQELYENCMVIGGKSATES
jgi:ribonuclease HII